MAERLTFSEYFAGIGLVRLGLEQQGWRVVFANDIDPRKYEMFSHFFGDDEHYLVDDIHELNIGPRVRLEPDVS